MMTQEEIKSLAFEWATDYKPWEDDLPPQKYAEYGFEQGFLWAVKIYNEKLKILMEGE
jgi:hypothetical protein